MSTLTIAMAKLLSFLRLLVLAVLALSSAVVASADADATEAARQKIVSGMAEGLQNNIELRRMLIGKHLDEDGGDPAAAAEQYRQIMRIQMQTFGEDSAEAAAALKEGAAFAEEHGLDKQKVLYVEENKEEL